MHRTTEGGTMKGLASVLGILILGGWAALAGPLELSFGAGLGAVSFTSFTREIGPAAGVLDAENRRYPQHAFPCRGALLG